MVDFDLAFNVIHVIASVIIVLYSATIIASYKKLNKIIPWLLIVTSYLCDLIGNIGWLNFVITLGADNAPYPSWVDVFYILYYVFFAAGIFLIWLNLLKILKYKGLHQNLIVLSLVTLIFGSFGYWLYINEYFESIVDVIYIVVSILTPIIGIPLLLLMRGSKLEKFWIFIIISGLLFSFAETLWSVFLTLEVSNYFPDVMWVTGYLLILYSLILYKKAIVKAIVKAK